MVIAIEGIVLCIVFTIMVYFISREPIKTLYNYPPMIQMRVKSLDEYKDRIPTEKNKALAKCIASILIIIVISFILRYINGYTTFYQGFGYGLILWTIVNLYDVIVLDIIWFCHDKRFVFKGTEDMVDEYHNYWFHIKGGLIGEALAVLICAIIGLIIQFIMYELFMIIEYDSKYDEEIKDLLVELQQYLANIDKEGYNIVGENYREEYFKKTIEDINNKDGKMLLYKENNEIVGLIVGLINNDEELRYDFKAPKRGRITELIVKEKYRGNHIGKQLLEEMTKYLKEIGCEKILIAVFGYNESAIKFYENNGYHVRMIDMIED